MNNNSFSSNLIDDTRNGLKRLISILIKRYPLLFNPVATLIIFFTISSLFSTVFVRLIPTNRAYVIYLICLLIISFIIAETLVTFLREIRIIKPPDGINFSPIGTKYIEDPFPRLDEVARVTNALEDQNANQLIVIAGTSGVGKSYLITTLLLDKIRMEKDWHVQKIISGFQNSQRFKDKIYESIVEGPLKNVVDLNTFHSRPNMSGNTSKENKMIFIFDQFEEFLDGSKKDDLLWFKVLLEQLTTIEMIKIIIIVRKEYFYQLKLLIEEDRFSIKLIDIKGISIDKNDNADAIKLLRKLRIVVKDDELFKEIHEDLTKKSEVLPLEIQMVGLMLEDINESKAKDGLQITKEDYIRDFRTGKGLIQRYFERYIDSSSKKDAAQAVLYAMSTEKRVRKRYLPGELAKITHRDSFSINCVLEELSSYGFVSKTEDGKYALSHDYLAEKYHELSGTFLDPIDRDNITFFSDIVLGIETNDGEMKSDLEKIKPVPHQKVISLINMSFVFLYLVLVERLFEPLLKLNWWIFADKILKIDPFYEISSFNAPIDIYYLPAFISISMTAWDILSFFKYFILLIPTKKFFSVLVLVIICITMLFGTLEPILWPMYLGMAGLLTCFRVLLSVVRKKGQLIQTHIILLRLRMTSIAIMVGSVFFIILGITYYLFVNEERLFQIISNNVITIKGIELILSLFLFIIMVIMAKGLASRVRGIIFLGTIARLQIIR